MRRKVPVVRQKCDGSKIRLTVLVARTPTTISTYIYSRRYIYARKRRGRASPAARRGRLRARPHAAPKTARRNELEKIRIALDGRSSPVLCSRLSVGDS